MAFLKVLIFCGIVAVAQVSADVWAGPGFAYAGAWGGNGIRMPMIQFPQIRFPNFQMPFIPMPVFTPIKIPTPEDIAKFKPKPGQVFNGIAVQSSSVAATDDQGKVIRDQSATIITNDGKTVKQYTVGNNPPDVKETIIPPTKGY